jgi:hypothetical protein
MDNGAVLPLDRSGVGSEACAAPGDRLADFDSGVGRCDSDSSDDAVLCGDLLVDLARAGGARLTVGPGICVSRRNPRFDDLLSWKVDVEGLLTSRAVTALRR